MSFSKTINKFLKSVYAFFSGLIFTAAVILVLLVGVAVVLKLESNKPELIIIGVALLFGLYYLWKKREHIFHSRKKSTNSVLFYEILKLTFGTLFFLVFLVNIYSPDLQRLKAETAKPISEEVILYTDSSDVAYEKYYLSQQTWRDFNRKEHRLPFRVTYQDVISSQKNREDFKITYKFSWNIFYKHLVDNDKPFVEELAQTFFKYQKEKQMSRREFAELMISAIQDIPYNLILPGSCEERDYKPCFGDVKLGLFAPAEFVSTLRGDCDTRTVILFTLLSRFNYQVAILNSGEYRHSILALNIPSTGTFKQYDKRKYYFVETTARGCPIGYINKEFSNLKHWDFVLVHNVKA